MFSDAARAGYDALSNLSGALESALIAALVAAAAIVCTIEVIKVPCRATFHFFIFRRWIKSKVRLYELLQSESYTANAQMRQSIPLVQDLASAAVSLYAPNVWFFRTAVRLGYMTRWRRYVRPRLNFSLPSGLLLKQVENAGREALERPTAVLYLFAAGAPLSSFGLAFEEEDRQEPSSLSLVAQEKLAAAVERNIDDLQVKIAFWWPTLLRWAGAILGIVFVYWAAHALVREVVPGEQEIPLFILVVIGLIAGYLAAVINDVVGILRGWNNSLSS